MKRLEDYVTSIPDFPEPGIVFKDVTSILEDAEGLQLVIESLQKHLEDVDFDVIVGAESKGFMFAMPLAYILKRPFVPVRRKGKLPRTAISQEYRNGAGTGVLEIHEDAITPGAKVVLIDDVLASGATMEAAAKIVEKLGGKVVKILFVMELGAYEGRKRLAKYPVDSLIRYEGR